MRLASKLMKSQPYQAPQPVLNKIRKNVSKQKTHTGSRETKVKKRKGKTNLVKTTKLANEI